MAEKRTRIEVDLNDYVDRFTERQRAFDEACTVLMLADTALRAHGIQLEPFYSGMAHDIDGVQRLFSTEPDLSERPLIEIAAQAVKDARLDEVERVTRFVTAKSPVSWTVMGRWARERQEQIKKMASRPEDGGI